MTLGQFLLLVIGVIILFYVLKVGLALIIIGVAILVIYYIVRGSATAINNWNSNSYEAYDHTHPVVQYANPNLIPNIDRTFAQDYHMGYGNYWYIPIQEYMDNKPTIPSASCIVPNSISEYCVRQHMLQSGCDTPTAISKCSTSNKTGAFCIAGL